ncbi:NAD(P)H-dependent oxidoreductase subunit E [Alkaliphilus serpentinus]|uniref:NAD(P)H-dependent oxidoreductase subunit E n=2 Tax=Alkaliphilus serpentinus TaxID=1482731 RepID=A0A833M8F4_9FIRM|nr:NAD(P)H-dependent oxidoreductase subunit E [Alkaliphilus serpentinus]
MEIIDNVGNTPDKLLEVLIAVQESSEENYISEEQLVSVSKGLGVTLSKAYGVATFYSMLSLKQRGKYVIQLCNSAPCYVNKAFEIIRAFEENLGIKVGEVTDDGLFSLEFVSCIGACHMAPAVKINDEVFGNLDRFKVKSILEEIIRRER